MLPPTEVVTLRYIPTVTSPTILCYAPAMQNLLRRGATYYARLFIPADRWSDVGKAMNAAGGTKKEAVRTLQTTDIREARSRLRAALTAMQVDIDARLTAAMRTKS